MGTCLSTETTGQSGDFHAATKSSLKSRSASSSSRRLKIVIPSKSSAKANAASVLSPSEKTAATQPPTPSTPSSNGFAISPMTAASSTPQLEPLAEDEYEEYERNENVYKEEPESSFQSFVDSSSPLQFNRGNTVIDSIITEEESLGAPSDEEDMHDLHLKNASLKNGGDRPHPTHDTPLSTRSQSRIKILSMRVTAPASIIQRPPPLVAPPKGAVPDVIATGKSSVNPQTIANFNRLKVQVQLANRADKQRRHKTKLEDRFEDVDGYRNLWSEYEEIQNQVHSDAESRGGAPSRSDSLNLKQPVTWYFDFQSLKGKIHCDDDDADNRRQSSLSLLSEASMEVQRRLFEEKQRQRRRRRRNNGFVRDKRDVSDDRSISSVNSAVSRTSSVSFVRGRTDGNDYGPIKQVITSGASIPNTEASMDVGSDDSTPRAKSRSGEGDDYSRAGGYDDNSVISDLDMDNDYNVPRRRRRKTHTHDDSSLSTYGGRSMEDYRGLTTIDFETTAFQPRICDEAPPSIEFRKSNRIEQYGFDPSAPLSSQMDIFSVPSVKIDDAEPGVVRWRQFPDSPETGGKMSAARRLEDLYAADEEADKAATVKEKASTTTVSREEPKDRKEKAADETVGQDSLTGEQQEALDQKSSKETTKIVKGRETPQPEESKLRVPSRDQLNHSQEKVTLEMVDERTSMGSSDIVNDTETPQSKENEFPGQSVPGISGCIAAKELIDVATPTKDTSDTPTVEEEKLPDKESNDVVTNENPKSEAQEMSDCLSQNNYFRCNPFEQMSSEQFMMMSTFAMSSELNEDDDDDTGVSEEGQSEVSETCEIEKKSRPIESYDPVIEGMSTEAFLKFSSWHTGNYPSGPSTSLEASDSSVAPKNLDFQDEADSSTLDVSQNNEDPSEVSTSSLDMASTKVTTFSESREDNTVDSSLFNVASAEDRRVSIERCDELAEKVSDEIGNLLSKFRESQGKVEGLSHSVETNSG